jgi:hypothetical protein
VSRPLGYPAAVEALKALYQLDPADGARWVETSDIEDAMYWAGRIGRGFLGRHVITCDGDGFRIQVAP